MTNDKWKQCAIELAKALRRNPYEDCGEQNHNGGYYHSFRDECPIVKMNRKALHVFDSLMDLDNPND